MNEADLKRCDEEMGCRDLWQMNTEEFNRKNLLALADEVPGLVAEVRRLNLQNDEMRGLLCRMRDTYPFTDVHLQGSAMEHAFLAINKYLEGLCLHPRRLTCSKCEVK